MTEGLSIDTIIAFAAYNPWTVALVVIAIVVYIDWKDNRKLDTLRILKEQIKGNIFILLLVLILMFKFFTYTEGDTTVTQDLYERNAALLQKLNEQETIRLKDDNSKKIKEQKYGRWVNDPI